MFIVNTAVAVPHHFSLYQTKRCKMVDWDNFGDNDEDEYTFIDEEAD